MSTARDVIDRALRQIGVLAAGESADASDMIDALAVLSDILEQWSIDSLMVYRRVQLVHPLGSAASYTIGPGADIDGPRPVAINSAIVRLQNIDTPLEIAADARFEQIGIKDVPARPLILHYDAGMPWGTIRLWPVPDTGYELHLNVDMQFSAPAVPQDDLVLPPGYRAALSLELAVALALEFGRPVPDSLRQRAMEAKGAIKRVNMQPDVAQFDLALSGRGTGNVRADFIAGV